MTADPMLTRMAADLAASRARQTGPRALLRAQAVAIYGGCCNGCGATDALEFDHVNNDGGQHRARESMTSVYRRIVAGGAPITDWDLQLLCPMCHLRKNNPKLRPIGTHVFHIVHRAAELTDEQRSAILRALGAAEICSATVIPVEEEAP